MRAPSAARARFVARHADSARARAAKAGAQMRDALICAMLPRRDAQAAFRRSAILRARCAQQPLRFVVETRCHAPFILPPAMHYFFRLLTPSPPIATLLRRFSLFFHAIFISLIDSSLFSSMVLAFTPFHYAAAAIIR